MIKGLVSIITPCYNGEKYLPETVRSVLLQTYKNWEMIIVDDGSNDASAMIAQRFAEKDSRIRLIMQENSGSASARNHGLRECKGQYIALLDADDIWLPKFLEKQIAFMKRKRAYVATCGYGRIDSKSKNILHPLIPKPVITVKDMEVMNRIGCLTGLYDCRKFGKIYLREELKSVRDDYAYWMDIVRLTGKAYGNQEVLAKYRVLDTSTTGNKKKLIKKQYQFQRQYLKKNPIIAGLNVLRWGIAGIKKFSK